MNLSTQEKAELKGRVNEIDLEPIKFKLVSEQGWDIQYADTIEPLYKHYLYLHALHDKIVPTKAVDEMWHAHILDTRKYHEDCQTAFGEYAHHFPYFGIRSVEDAKNLSSAFSQTVEMFAQDGIDLIKQSTPISASMAFCAANLAAMCCCDNESLGSGQNVRPSREDLLAFVA